MNTPPKKKKVLFIITKSNWGGAQRYVYDLATHLDKNLFSVTVAYGGDGQLGEMLAHAGIRTIAIKSLERDINLKKEWQSTKELWKIIGSEKPDILHLNSSKAGGIGALIGRLQFVPRVIFTAHGWAFNEDRPWWQRHLLKWLHYLTVLFSHQTIAVSRGLRQQLTWLGAQRKIRVINPGRTIGVMYNKTEARSQLAKLHPPLADHTPARYTWIGTVAELHPIKRLPVLINAMSTLKAKHPQVRCIIIGTGSEQTHLQSLIKEHNLSDIVFLTGAVPEAARFLHSLDIFVLPSKSESYGYVVHEAGLARLPVIATSVGGITDIITNQVDGLLIGPDDTIALTKAVEKLLTDQQLRERLRKTLLEKVQTRTVEKMTHATEALYLHT